MLQEFLRIEKDRRKLFSGEQTSNLTEVSWNENNGMGKPIEISSRTILNFEKHSRPIKNIRDRTITFRTFKSIEECPKTSITILPFISYIRKLKSN